MKTYMDSLVRLSQESADKRRSPSHNLAAKHCAYAAILQAYRAFLHALVL